MLLTNRSQPISMYFLQFTPLLNTNNFLVYFPNFALLYSMTAKQSALPLLTILSTYPIRTALSALFSCHCALYFTSSLTLQFPSPSSQLFVTHTLSQPHSQTSQLYCRLGSLCSADGMVQCRQLINSKCVYPVFSVQCSALLYTYITNGTVSSQIVWPFLCSISTVQLHSMTLLKASLSFKVECSGLDFLYSE